MVENALVLKHNFLHLHQLSLYFQRYTKLDEISKRTKEKLEKNGINVKFAAEASVPGLGSASSSREFAITTEDKKNYENSIEHTRIVTTGSHLPADGKVGNIIFSKFMRKLK